MNRISARDIVRAVITSKAGIDAEDFFGSGKERHLALARAEAAHHLKRAGFSVNQIARVLKRDPSTISNYLYPKLRAAKKARYEQRKVQLSAEISRLVRDYAKQERINVDTAANELLRSCLSTAA